MINIGSIIKCHAFKVFFLFFSARAIVINCVFASECHERATKDE